METLRIHSPHHIRKMLIKDHDAYVESLGKQDIPALTEVLEHHNGAGTVVRMFLGATEKMPLRALSYVASAARVAQLVPCEQLQIISVNKLGEKINGVDKQASSAQTRLLAVLGQGLLRGFMPDVHEKVTFAEDKDTSHVDQFIPYAQKAMDNMPAIAASLREKGAKHGGDFVNYGAAHVAYQDTAGLQLEKVTGQDPVDDVKRIVSVGCMQERTFYALRMAMRDLIDDSELVPAVQVFTRHVSPPYYQARHGEQEMTDALSNGVDMSSIRDMAARRDMEHLATIVGVK